LETIAFGNALQRCRVACLREIQSPHRALIVGEGNGRFLCALLREHPRVEVDYVDASERMLHLARGRIENELPDRRGQVRFRHHDITKWVPAANHYDLVVTHFVLDCFRKEELAAVIQKLASSATPEADWLLADFRLPDRGFARLQVRTWLAAMYQFFRFTARIRATELIDPTPYLQANGFALARQHLFRRGMLKSELWRNIGIPPVRPASKGFGAVSDSAE
jgi:ubiquinone/menaquinone biosynthesis C-methylase UbiE